MQLNQTFALSESRSSRITPTSTAIVMFGDFCPIANELMLKETNKTKEQTKSVSFLFVMVVSASGWKGSHPKILGSVFLILM